MTEKQFNSLWLPIYWSDEKNMKLIQDRNIWFENVLIAIENNKLVSVIRNPSKNHPHQECMVINIDNYIYLVPFVQDDEKIFLKTIFASRKYTKYFLKK